MVFIRVIQHTHAPVRCFNFVLICLELNFITSDYKKTHLTLHPFEWDCIYLFSDVQNCVVIDVFWFVCFRHFEIEPLIVLFKIAGLWFWAILTLIGWYLCTHPQLLPNLEKRVIHCQKDAEFFALVSSIAKYSWSFRKFSFPYKCFLSCWQHEQFLGVRPWGMISSTTLISSATFYHKFSSEL